MGSDKARLSSVTFCCLRAEETCWSLAYHLLSMAISGINWRYLTEKKIISYRTYLPEMNIDFTSNQKPIWSIFLVWTIWDFQEDSQSMSEWYQVKKIHSWNPGTFLVQFDPTCWAERRAHERTSFLIIKKVAKFETLGITSILYYIILYYIMITNGNMITHQKNWILPV